MKASGKVENINVLLFWSLPSISTLAVYKEKCNKLKLAIQKMKSVEIVSIQDEVLKLEKIEIHSGKFFGIENIKGTIKKTLLNVNDIKLVNFIESNWG